ncbi:hypothetical protein [Shimia sp.]|uniref:hypothetical protein n=1 Tax=Shimia sp. TaxID=1954381 RepID=UPI003B8D64F2
MNSVTYPTPYVIGGDCVLNDADPARYLALAVDNLNVEDSDEAFVGLTGDMTHWGNPDEYAAFEASIHVLNCVHVLKGRGTIEIKDPLAPHL